MYTVNYKILFGYDITGQSVSNRRCHTHSVYDKYVHVVINIITTTVYTYCKQSVYNNAVSYICLKYKFLTFINYYEKVYTVNYKILFGYDITGQSMSNRRCHTHSVYNKYVHVVINIITTTVYTYCKQSVYNNAVSYICLKYKFLTFINYYESVYMLIIKFYLDMTLLGRVCLTGVVIHTLFTISMYML